jgi:hypothetical protein
MSLIQELASLPQETKTAFAAEANDHPLDGHTCKPFKVLLDGYCAQRKRSVSRIPLDFDTIDEAKDFAWSLLRDHEGALRVRIATEILEKDWYGQFQIAEPPIFEGSVTLTEDGRRKVEVLE